MRSGGVCSSWRKGNERVVAGALVGSLAVGGADRFSDLDLTFGVAGSVPVADVLEDWTRAFVDELDAVHLADLERGPTIYRVFLLPDALQFDLSMTPAARFRPAGPRFRLLFGEAAPSEVSSRPVTGGPVHRDAARCGIHLRVGRHLRAPRARVHRAGPCLAGRALRRCRARPRALARLPPPGTFRGAGAQLRRSSRGEPRRIRGGPCRHGRPCNAPIGARRVRRRPLAGRRGGAPTARSSRRGATC
jgi:hypothetical protein